MRWLLAGCCGFLLIHISVALKITQKPRFYGVPTGRSVAIHCQPQQKQPAAVALWYKVSRYDEDPAKGKEVREGHRIEVTTQNETGTTVLHIYDLQLEDKGMFFCRVADSWGPGTELQVARPVQRAQALYRTKMKDGLMVLQALLLAVCIAALLLRKRRLFEKSDSIYEEPETDHIYEGLTIETCGGGLYEELSVYAQPDGAEAPWE